jgi:hypothetical protein
MFKFTPRTIVKERKTGGLYRIIEAKFIEAKNQGSKHIHHRKAYVITPIIERRVTRWCVDEDSLELAKNFPDPYLRKLSRWDALLKVCREEIRH